MKYLYYALFKKQSDDKIEVTFPDLAPTQQHMEQRCQMPFIWLMMPWKATY